MTLKLDTTASHLMKPETCSGPFKDWGVIATSGLVFHRELYVECESSIWNGTCRMNEASQKST
jgi:hypothetical protein